MRSRAASTSLNVITRRELRAGFRLRQGYSGQAAIENDKGASVNRPRAIGSIAPTHPMLRELWWRVVPSQKAWPGKTFPARSDRWVEAIPRDSRR